jgi:uncharacterized protein with PIN domain
MAKIKFIDCPCGNQIQQIWHDGIIRQIENPETHELQEWYYWQCTECGKSFKQLKPESIIIK